MGGWVCEKKKKLMLYSSLVEIEVEIGVMLGNKDTIRNDCDLKNADYKKKGLI